MSFGNIATGADIKEITSADINDSTIIGRNSHGFREIGQYNTVYIPFPEQPALTPNTSYRVGYTLEEEGYFALAQQAQGSYRYASPPVPTAMTPSSTSRTKKLTLNMQAISLPTSTASMSSILPTADLTATTSGLAYTLTTTP